MLASLLGILGNEDAPILNRKLAGAGRCQPRAWPALLPELKNLCRGEAMIKAVAAKAPTIVLLQIPGAAGLPDSLLWCTQTVFAKRAHMIFHPAQSSRP